MFNQKISQMKKCALLLVTHSNDGKLKFGFAVNKNSNIVLCCDTIDRSEPSSETILKTSKYILGFKNNLRQNVKKCYYTENDQIYFIYSDMYEDNRCKWLDENEINIVSGYGKEYLPNIIELIKKYIEKNNFAI